MGEGWRMRKIWERCIGPRKWISALKQGLEGVWSLPQWDWEMPDLAGNFLADLDGKSQRTNVVREQGRTSE